MEWITWFVLGVLVASVVWGFITLTMYYMLIQTEKKYRDFRNKALKDLHQIKKTGGFKV